MAVSAGTRLGPYEILEPLGAGGMGEVYRARDPRLERDVALKVLRPEVADDPDRLRRFEREAKTVAALNHPHILTVFDVGTHDGTPYVVTELLEGETLRQVLKTRSPTQTQVLTFAVQIARGLAAAHDKDIVHRDLKPENLFLTTDGRIKILDFGLAKLTTREEDLREADTPGVSEDQSTSPGVILGTVAYMSPEQAKAHPLDNRSDIFSFGVVLYEMLAHRHPFLRDTAPATLTAIATESPPDLASSGRAIPPALARIVHRCLEKEREDRFRGTHDLALALEAVLQAPGGAAALEDVEERSPYPGLSSFTENDAAVFFGREAEVDELWSRIRNRKLLALIGPSGAGKTSFVRAGIVAHRPPGWNALVMTPGAQPFRGLMRALAPALAGDSEALRLLADIEEPDTAVELLARWRRSEGEGLLVVDQLEELFTQNPPEVQERFAALLGHVASEADVHVLLSLRDDFLIRCGERAPLAPVVQGLTLLLALKPEDLRRAIEEPARERGYAFEDDALVVEMLQSVEGARGALPLLAFAVARLWEKRDRESRLLTRAAYEQIGGVAGALAQHAEQTLEGIGLEREPIVRELFRNLVTAQWTRAVAEREQLLSVLPDSGVGARVLDQLVDARLLTSYEVQESHSARASVDDPTKNLADAQSGAASAATTHRIEIVHESLLKAWPRLVRWQAQDEEGAVLRDQLKQAAHLWEEKERSEDLLWSGTAYQEYVLWRGRYPGALTALEEDFARAMADQAARRRRRRRLAASFVVSAAVLVAIVTGALWRRSEAARERAREEALRAEAGKLLALGRNHLEDDSTAALAYARKSLDLYDTPEARRFVPEVLWRGPVARLLDLNQSAKAVGLPAAPERFGGLIFSPDGRWLVGQGPDDGQVLLFDRDGGPTQTLSAPLGRVGMVPGFGPGSDILVTGGPGPSLTFWSLPSLREQRSVPIPSVVNGWGLVRGGKIVLVAWDSADGSRSVQVMDFSDEGPRVKATTPPGVTPSAATDSEATQAMALRGRQVALLSLDGTDRLRPLGELRGDPMGGGVSLRGDLVVVSDASGQARVWSQSDGDWHHLRTLRGPAYSGATLTLVDEQGRRLSQAGPNGAHVLWDLEEFPDARPLVLGRARPLGQRHGSFDPSGRWLAMGNPLRTTVEFWPVASPHRRVLPDPGGGQLVFTPDSRWLTTCSFLRALDQWPLKASEGAVVSLGAQEDVLCNSVALDPAGREVVVGTYADLGRGQVLLYLVRGGAPRRLVEKWDEAWFFIVAYDPQGRRGVAVPGNLMGGIEAPESRALMVWDPESGEKRVHSISHLTDADWGLWVPVFAPDGRLYMGGQGGVRRLTLPTETDAGGTISSETIHAAGFAAPSFGGDPHQLLVFGTRAGKANDPYEELLLIDLVSGTSRPIKTHGTRLSRAALSPSGRIIVSGDRDGVVRVGPSSGGEPHLLLGHKGAIGGLAISPDERWIASSTEESISIWPMPDVTQPPLHTLPHEELLAKLDALTNLRVVRDPSSPTGWSEEIGPFPGWKDVPTW